MNLPILCNRRSFLRFIGCLVVVATMLPLWGDANCLPQPSNLVSWWRGEGDGSDVIGSNQGTLIGNTTFEAGMNGQAFVFDGDGDVVTVGNPPNLQLQDFTIETWIKRSDASVVSFGSGGVGVIFGYGDGGYSVYLDSGGTLYFGKLGTTAFASSAFVADTNFHHVALTKSGGRVVFYVDGNAHVGPDFNPVFEFITDAAIGGRGDNLDNSFLGLIDEISVYSRALSTVEIQALYAAGGDGKCTSPSAPVILGQPADAAAEVGGVATFSVQALGTPPLSYQWRFNQTNLVGGSASVLVITNVLSAAVGSYSVTVTNDYGETTSSNALLSIPSCFSWPTGIVSWWRGEGNAFDHFGQNSGTLAGNAGYAAGRVGLGFAFDGNSDAVIVSNHASLHLQDFTVETWVGRSNSAVASFGSGGNGVLCGFGAGGYLVWMDSGGRFFFSRLGAGAVSSGWVVNDTNHHHIALTKNNTVVTFYLDGTNSSSATYGQSFVFNTPFGIGARPDNLDNSFYGTIDELSVYNRALSSSEVQAIRNAGGAGKCVDYLAPTITAQPTNRTALPGTNVAFTVSVFGTPPLSCQWRRNGSAIVGATNITLTLTNVQPSNAGSYSILLTSAGGVAISSNALLKVIVVSAFGNGLALTNAAYAFSGAVNVQLQNAYTSGLLFYTLDGSQPTFASAQYTGPFVLSNSVVLRALGYSADFFESGELDPIAILLPPAYPLTVSSGGGGSVNANPPAGPYLSNAVVTLTATPAAGWQFLQWLGDATGNNPVLGVTMNRPRSVQAVFGTTLSTTAAGGGSVTLNPPGGVYPYGATVQLSAIPQLGNFFALWGNAASGNVNPLSYVLTNANPTVSSLFSAVGGGQSALTVVPVGRGRVSLSPRANAYSTGAGVTITATPDAGQSFIGWSGDASGAQNPLSSTVNSNTTIYANFTKRPVLVASDPFGSLKKEGVQLTITGDPGEVYELAASTNLVNWLPLINLTNSNGTAQFVDSTGTNFNSRFYRAVTLP